MISITGTCKIYRIGIIISSLAILVCLFPLNVIAVPISDLGEPKGFITDFYGALSSGEKRELNSISSEIQAENSAELAIVIIDSTDGLSIEDYAQELFDSWEFGTEEADNGLLILVAMNDHKWRIHTGYGIESAIPDSLAGRIMQHEVVPKFKEGEYGAGLINAVRVIQDILSGEKYTKGAPNWILILMIPAIGAFIGILIWLSVRIKCTRCGSRVNKTADRAILDATYSHSGIRKIEYECTVCSHDFSRMSVLPMLVESSSGDGGTTIFGGGWSSGGSGGGGGGFGGFSGGSSGGGGASGGW